MARGQKAGTWGLRGGGGGGEGFYCNLEEIRVASWWLSRVRLLFVLIRLCFNIIVSSNHHIL
jgi:hypothetical protein